MWLNEFLQIVHAHVIRQEIECDRHSRNLSPAPAQPLSWPLTPLISLACFEYIQWNHTVLTLCLLVCPTLRLWAHSCWSKHGSCSFVFLGKYNTIYLSILLLIKFGVIPILWLLKQCFYEHFYISLLMHIWTHSFGIFNTLVSNYWVITNTYIHSAFWHVVNFPNTDWPFGYALL